MTECKAYGGYVPYSVGSEYYFDADNLAKLGITDKYTVANYDNGVVEEKTIFTPVCQTALCASCGKKLPAIVQNDLKKPVTSSTTPTAADYKTPYGNWVYTLTAKEDLTNDLCGVSGIDMKEKDIATMSFLVKENTADAEKPTVEVYVMYYDDNYTVGDKTWTYFGSAGNVKFDYTSKNKVRTLSFSLPAASVDGASTEAATVADALNGKYIVLSEESGKYTMTLNTQTAYPTIPKSEVGEDNYGKYTATLEYSAAHTSHTFTVMKHYNVNRIEIAAEEDGSDGEDYGIGTDEFLGLHYEECTCGIKYKMIKHKEDENYVSKTAAAADKHIKCAKCGYNSAADAFFEVTVNDGKANVDEFVVAKDSLLTLSFSEYTPFNKAKVEIVGWGNSGKILNQGDSTFKGKRKINMPAFL